MRVAHPAAFPLYPFRLMGIRAVGLAADGRMHCTADPSHSAHTHSIAVVPLALILVFFILRQYRPSRSALCLPPLPFLIKALQLLVEAELHDL